MTDQNLSPHPLAVHIPIGSSLSDCDTLYPAAVKSSYQKYLESQLEQEKDYHDPLPVISILIAGVLTSILTLKSFSLHQGKSKSRKTTTLALMIASYISESSAVERIKFVAGIRGCVLFLDCEQGESYAARTMKLILKLAGLKTSERLIYCDLREYSPQERVEIIAAALDSNPDIRLVVVDGVVDLMSDFMDAAEGHMTILTLLQLCSRYNVHVAGVLHQNKGDKNPRAHVGSVGSQKCEVEISAEIDEGDKGRSIISCVRSRGLPFEDFAIRWDRGDLPRIDQEWTFQKGITSINKTVDPSDLTFQELETLAGDVFKKEKNQKYAGLLDNVVLSVTAFHKKIGQSKARSFIKHLENEGLIKTEGKAGTKYCTYLLC